jgi:hypothetical protein
MKNIATDMRPGYIIKDRAIGRRRYIYAVSSYTLAMHMVDYVPRR